MTDARSLSGRIQALEPDRTRDLANRASGTLWLLVAHLERHHDHVEPEHEGCGACALIIHLENEYQAVLEAADANV